MDEMNEGQVDNIMSLPASLAWWRHKKLHKLHH